MVIINRYARWFIGLLMLGLSAGMTAIAVAADPAPKLVFPESSYHFKSAVEGQSVVHDFTVKNTGDAMLNIRRVKSG